jgi:putative alpha-1,2-mannosidase
MADDSLLDLVNIRQGTGSHFGFSQGNTLPLIARPFGMTHWCPQTNGQRGGWFFHPGDRKLEGIRATHQPSPWIGDYGTFVIMPQTGALHPVADCPYARSVTWNGQPWNRLWIGHADLVQGGELGFLLSDQAPPRRTYTADELPFSLTPHTCGT